MPWTYLPQKSKTKSLHMTSATKFIKNFNTSGMDKHPKSRQLNFLSLFLIMLGAFYNLTGVSDFIIDILLGCPHHEIRNAALEQLYTLSITEGINDNFRTLHPRQFLLQVLLKVPVPLWTSSCFVRGASQK